MNRPTALFALAAGMLFLPLPAAADYAYPLKSVRACVNSMLNSNTPATPQVAATYCACLDRELNRRITAQEQQSQEPAIKAKVDVIFDEATTMCRNFANGS